jgi:hypothetical protein
MCVFVYVYMYVINVCNVCMCVCVCVFVCPGIYGCPTSINVRECPHLNAWQVRACDWSSTDAACSPPVSLSHKVTWSRPADSGAGLEEIVALQYYRVVLVPQAGSAASAAK